jgi:predicted ATPase/DNA-binding XRE family transcriptional regulator
MVADAHSFAALLRQQRQASGLTQEGLAERARLSVRAISDLERGLKERPHATTVQLLIQALGLDGASAEAFTAAASRRVAKTPPAFAQGTLPVALTSFIGRQEACADVKQALTTARSLTLVGAGGIGKTRLALEVASAVGDEYPDGVWLVELASLADGTLVTQTVATALGIREQPGRPLLTSLLDGLRTRKLLLVVDNCEHVRQACGDLIQALLRTCATVRVLGTSREPLGAAGEVVWRVPPLEVPDACPHGVGPDQTTESVRLFVERAHAAVADFKLDSHNAAAVAEICRRLDGLPLAIELAAPLVRVLSPAEIAARIDDRFGLLPDGGRSVPAHQQSLRTAITWGYRDLRASDQRLFDELSIFAGGWTLESAAAVSSTPQSRPHDIVHVMADLVDRSLIVADVRMSARYRMFETLRQFGREQLAEFGDPAAAAASHAAFYATLAEKAFAEIFGPGQIAWLGQLEIEHDNLRAALAWGAARGDTEFLVRLSGCLGNFWILVGHWSEGRRWIDT